MHGRKSRPRDRYKWSAMRALLSSIGRGAPMRAWRSRFKKNLSLWLKRRAYMGQYRAGLPGSAAWLIGGEIHYGGVQLGVPRTRISPWDPRVNSHPRPRMMGG